MVTLVRRTRVRWLGAADPGWDAALEGVPRDVYHTAAYHAVAEASGEGTAWLVVVGDRAQGLAWPYLLRAVPSSIGGRARYEDVSSVYGYPGPLAWGCGPGDPFLAHAWATILEAWRAQGVVSVFSRFHPLLGNAALASGFAAAGVPEPGVVEMGQTVSVDCRLDDETASAQYARPLRQHLAAARRAGALTECDETWRYLPAFAALYDRTMERNRSAASYRWGLIEFERLRTALGDALHLLVTRIDGLPAAAGLFTEFEGIVQAHLIGSDEAFRGLSPSKVLLDDARRWAGARGDAVLHLGGGRGGQNDSLFRFKREFSARRHVFHTGRWVVDPDAYAQLAAAHRGAAPAGLVPDPGFFPAYRSPFVEPAADAAPSGGATEGPRS